MTKYYISNENSWQTEKSKQEKIGQGIDVLYDIDRWLDRAYRQLEYDKYGLMSRNSYTSRRTKIQQCDKKNSILHNYSKSIHGIVADKDFQFFKELNKAYEELSLLDIKEYTTKNTLNITEKKTIPISYYSGSMAYQSGTATSYATRDVLKGNINIYDIQMKCDMFRIEEQLKAYLDTSGEKLSDKEIKEAKENFYKGILNTSFEHEIYADDFFKGLSTTLDFIPVVGGVKNVIEGCTGYTMTGEKLRDSERATYAVLGTLSTALDFATFGTASGLIQGGKYVGKEVAKASIKQATKVAIQQTTGSIVMGWTSQFASEKLRDMGLSSEEIFAIHILVGASTVGISKLTKDKVIDSKTFTNWDEMKNANKGTVTKLVNDYKPNGTTHPRKWLATEGTSLTIDTVKRPFGSTYQVWNYTDSTGVVTSGIKGINDMTLGQLHHYTSNKNKEYLNKFESITSKYELDLDGDWNKGYISSHIGSHPKEYHGFILEQLKKADRFANGDLNKFKKYYKKLVIDKVNKNPDMLNASYWRNK